MLINLPIESLEERYSAAWNRGFPQEFTKRDVPYRTIYPQLSEGIERISRGQFLDVVRTNEFKASQLALLMQALDQGLIKDRDVLLFHDLWFPGLEMLFYVRDGLGINFKIAGLLHAGTYDEHDFLAQRSMTRWARGMETAWWSEVDAIFVATEFHKKLLVAKRLANGNHVYVTGFPLFGNSVLIDPGLKENIVVFPHRLAPEKGPEAFHAIRDLCLPHMPEWQFIRTKDVCKTKQEYYDLLRRSKIAVSCAHQETWGIAQQEALFRGCIPIVPDRLSYQELYPPVFRYQDPPEAAALIQHFSRRWEETVNGDIFKDAARKLEAAQGAAVPNMLQIMRSRGWNL